MIGYEANLLSIAVLSNVFYIAATLMQSLGLYGQWIRTSKWGMIFLAFIAICLHGILLHAWIDIRSGQNLNFINLLSLSAWLIAIITVLVVVIKPVDVLAIFIFPVTAATIVLGIFFRGKYVLNLTVHTDTIFHILLSIFTFCVLCMAALLAILLSIQERLLRFKPEGRLIQKLPPIESMEILLFQVIGMGFILLNVLLLTSLYFFHSMLWANALLVQKTVLATAAWIIFAILLIGRHQRGWRGRKAINYTVCGAILLCLAYFCSESVISLL